MNIKKIFVKIKFPEKKDKEIIKIQNKKNRYIFILRMLSILIMAFLVGVIIATVLFVYETVMNTIGQVQSISLYQSELRVELIDFNRLDKIEKKWEEKISDEKPNIKRNPFSIAKDIPIIIPSVTTTTESNPLNP
jgi:hypothetical protein